MPKPTVLIIDDDEDVLSMYRAKLEATGFVVHTATDGDEGVKRATELEPDAILLDYMMPAVDGGRASTRSGAVVRPDFICSAVVPVGAGTQHPSSTRS